MKSAREELLARMTDVPKPYRPRAKGLQPETKFQIAVAELLDWVLAPPYRYTAIGHGVALTQATQHRLAAMGLKRGWTDMVIVGPSRGVWWLELKIGRTPLSKPQRALHEALAGLGHHIAIARTLDEVRGLLFGWGISTRERRPSAEIVEALGRDLAKGRG